MLFKRIAAALVVVMLAVTMEATEGKMMKSVIKDSAMRNVLGISTPEESPQDYYLFQLFPDDFLQQIASGNYTRELYPRFAEREAWQRIAASPEKERFVKLALAEAEKSREAPLPQLSYSKFVRYAVDGNRAEYEELFYNAASQMNELALALCLTGDREKYLMPLLDRIDLLLGTNTWCLPAHCAWTEDGVLKKHHRADLASCQIAAQMGLIYRLLGDELEAASEGISERMRAKIYEESIGKVLNPETTALCHWYHNDYASNWVAWCSANCLLTAVCIEDDPQRLAQMVEAFLYALSRYIHFSDADGFTCEGVTYFAVSGGKMFQALELMERLVPGSTDKVFADSKIRAIVEFVPRMRFGAGFVCYSDCVPYPKLPYDLLNGCAQRFDSLPFRRLAGNPERSSFVPGLGEDLSRQLRNLFHVVETGPVADATPEQVLYENRLGIVHAGKFSLAVKAGNNAEMHNHNDLGHFAIAYDNTDIAIDAGTGVYSKDNFSEKRYTLWYNNAGSHNAPVLDGVMQEFGAEYTSTLTMESGADGSHTLVCDLGKAYPAAAGVKAFVRRSTVAAERVTIHDRIEWQGREVVINLLCLGKPEKCRGGLLLGGKVLLRGEGIEVREICLQEEKFTNWPAPIYKVVLATSASEYKLCFSPTEK